MKFYLVYKNHGLYDPVLDDHEPIFEPIEPLDFDQPSPTTEVQFQLNEFPETHELSESRSLTASPFVIPTKPYRPFSTEPIPDVPPLENPIILNANYQDELVKYGITEDLLPKTRFKLPISEHYDPDGKRKKEVIQKEEIKKENTFTEEINVREQMHEEIDLEKIELTAKTIVDESIERAVIITEDIQEEIALSLQDSGLTSSNDSAFKINRKSTLECKQLKNHEQAINKLQNRNNVSEEVNEFVLTEKSNSKINYSNIKDSEITSCKKDIDVIDNEIAKVIESSHGIKMLEESNDSQVYNTITENDNYENVAFYENNTSEQISETSIKAKKFRSKSEIVGTENFEIKDKSMHKQKTHEENLECKSSDANKSRANLLSEKRAYTIGLQTIPNIRGSVHSSYKYNLLLKTFFIHLTDVMVALSRFILTEPILPESLVYSQNDKENIIKNTSLKESMKSSNTIINSLNDNNITQTNNENNGYISENNTEYVEQEQFVTKRSISGSKMAQLSEKRSEELTQKMDAVISEFQEKTFTCASTQSNKEIGNQCERKSSSRSKIEEEVLKENDPLEWLSKLDNKNDTTVMSTQISSSSSELLEVNKIQAKHNVEDMKFSKSTGAKNTYIAIVEAHVYTNKDAILEEQFSEISETASLQSAEEINFAADVVETVSAENLAVESTHIETGKSSDIFETFTEDLNKEETTCFTEIQKIKQDIDETVSVEAHETIIQKQSVLTDTSDSKQSFVEIPQSENLLIVNTGENKSKIEQTQNLENIVKEVNKVVSSGNLSSQTKEQILENIVENESKIEQTENLDNIVKEVNKFVSSGNLSSQTTEQILDFIETREEVQEIEEHVNACQDIEKNKITEGFSSVDINDSVGKINFQQEISDVITLDSKIHEISPSNAVEIVEAQQISDDQKCSSLLLQDIEIGSNECIQIEKLDIKEEFENHRVNVQSKDYEKSIKLDSEISKYITTEKIITDYANSVETKTLLTNIESNSVSNSYQAQKSQDVTAITKSLKLSLRTDLIPEKTLEHETSVESDEKNNIDTPTPSTVPPTPLTDEYVFRLEIPLPKNITPVPREPTPEEIQHDEDPNIVKKKLIPHIETTIERIVYDPPLPTPPADNAPSSPTFSKPGLKGGSDKMEFTKEDILEIERKSSLLASAIDETIRNIEEYKESVGLETEKNNKINIKTQSFVEERNENNRIFYNGFSEVKNKVYNTTDSLHEKMEEEWNDIQKQVDKQNQSLNHIQGNITSISRKDIPHSDPEFISFSENKKNNHMATKADVIVSTNKSDSKTHYRILDQEKSQKENSKLKETENKNIGDDIVELRHKDQEHIKRDIYMTESGEILGTCQGIVDGLEDVVLDEEVAKQLGKPGMTEEKIAELISGESEMLREAHVMGLSRVLSSHMNRSSDDDSSVNFKKIKPVIESLNDSEVLKALNEEVTKTEEEKKKEERKWTKFLQKPERPVPKMKYGYYRYISQEDESPEKPYEVKIVKQPKPKVAPDYKPEDFETGPLPWEERALREPSPPPVKPEDPILIPEDKPEFFEAVDPLPESEVPDLEETGITIPPEEVQEDKPLAISEEQNKSEEQEDIEAEEIDPEPIVKETEKTEVEMEENKIADQLIKNVQRMVDPSATLDQQLTQMRAQLAALAQLPGVIQQTLELVTKQLMQITQQESTQMESETRTETENCEEMQETQNNTEAIEERVTEEQQAAKDHQQESVEEPQEKNKIIETMEEKLNGLKSSLSHEELEIMKKEEEEMLEEQRKIEKQKKALMEQMQQELQSRQLKQRPTPRVGKPKPVFGPLTPQERPVILPGGRKWRKPKDAYNEQFIAETLSAQAEIIQGKAKGINFMKYEKPPVSLDHLQHSDVYKLIHNMEQPTMKRVEMLTPVMAEADYREKCRSVTPNRDRMAMEERLNIPQQVQP